MRRARVPGDRTSIRSSPRCCAAGEPDRLVVSPLVTGYCRNWSAGYRTTRRQRRACLKDADYPSGFTVQLDWRQRHLPRGGVPGDHRDAGAVASAPPSAVAPARCSSQADAGRRRASSSSVIPTHDAWSMLNSIVRSYDGTGAGQFNAAATPNAKLDGPDRRDPHRTRCRPPPATGGRRAAADGRRPAAAAAVPAQDQLGDAAEHPPRAVAPTTSWSCARARRPSAAAGLRYALRARGRQPPANRRADRTSPDQPVIRPAPTTANPVSAPDPCPSPASLSPTTIHFGPRRKLAGAHLRTRPAPAADRHRPGTGRAAVIAES